MREAMVPYDASGRWRNEGLHLELPLPPSHSGRVIGNPETGISPTTSVYDVRPKPSTITKMTRLTSPDSRLYVQLVFGSFRRPRTPIGSVDRWDWTPTRLGDMLSFL
jgi:hypothetical protein